jgi:hypothetical protein
MSEITRVRALCCECGNPRTVSANYKRRNDGNQSGECDDDPRGWRLTCTLKCSVCGARTRHAMLRDDAHRDFAELRKDERHAAIRRDVANNAEQQVNRVHDENVISATPPGYRLVEYKPGYRILEYRRSAEATKHGRHPGVSRELAVVGDSGNWIATAWEYRDHWMIDVEDHALRIGGARTLGLLHSYVRREDDAVDWLRWFGTLVSKVVVEDDPR